MDRWIDYTDPYVQELENQVRDPFRGSAVARAMIEIKGDLSGTTVYSFKEGWYLRVDRTGKIQESDEEAAYLKRHADIVVE